MQDLKKLIREYQEKYGSKEACPECGNTDLEWQNWNDAFCKECEIDYEGHGYDNPEELIPAWKYHLRKDYNI